MSRHQDSPIYDDGGGGGSGAAGRRSGMTSGRPSGEGRNSNGNGNGEPGHSRGGSGSSWWNKYPSWLPKRPSHPPPESTPSPVSPPSAGGLPGEREQEQEQGTYTPSETDEKGSYGYGYSYGGGHGGRRAQSRSVRIVSKSTGGQSQSLSSASAGGMTAKQRSGSQHLSIPTVREREHEHEHDDDEEEAEHEHELTGPEIESPLPTLKARYSLGLTPRQPRQPRFRAPGLRLVNIESPSLFVRIRFYVLPILVFGHLVLQTFLDLNVIYMLIQLTKFPSPTSIGPASSRTWALASAAYIFCWVVQIFGIFLLYEVVYSFYRRWRIKRPLIAPLYLSSSAHNFVCISSYSNFCFFRYIRRSAFRGNRRNPQNQNETMRWKWIDALAEQCYFYLQNLPTVLSLLPRAALCMALLFTFRLSGGGLPAGNAASGVRDTTFFKRADGTLTGYARGILIANAVWTGWRVLIVILSSIVLWILSGKGCAGLCGPRYRWDEDDDRYEREQQQNAYYSEYGPTADPTIYDPLGWHWRERTLLRIKDAWEFCLTYRGRVGLGAGKESVRRREKARERERGHGHAEKIALEEERPVTPGGSPLGELDEILAGAGFKTPPVPGRRKGRVLSEVFYETPPGSPEPSHTHPHPRSPHSHSRHSPHSHSHSRHSPRPSPRLSSPPSPGKLQTIEDIIPPPPLSATALAKGKERDAPLTSLPFPFSYSPGPGPGAGASSQQATTVQQPRLPFPSPTSEQFPEQRSSRERATSGSEEEAEAEADEEDEELEEEEEQGEDSGDIEQEILGDIDLDYDSSPRDETSDEEKRGSNSDTLSSLGRPLPSIHGIVRRISQGGATSGVVGRSSSEMGAQSSSQDRSSVLDTSFNSSSDPHSPHSPHSPGHGVIPGTWRRRADTDPHQPISGPSSPVHPHSPGVGGRGGPAARHYRTRTRTISGVSSAAAARGEPIIEPELESDHDPLDGDDDDGDGDGDGERQDRVGLLSPRTSHRSSSLRGGRRSLSLSPRVSNGSRSVSGSSQGAGSSSGSSIRSRAQSVIQSVVPTVLQQPRARAHSVESGAGARGRSSEDTSGSSGNNNNPEYTFGRPLPWQRRLRTMSAEPPSSPSPGAGPGGSGVTGRVSSDSYSSPSERYISSEGSGARPGGHRRESSDFTFGIPLPPLQPVPQPHQVPLPPTPPHATPTPVTPGTPSDLLASEGSSTLLEHPSPRTMTPLAPTPTPSAPMDIPGVRIRHPTTPTDEQQQQPPPSAASTESPSDISSVPTSMITIRPVPSEATTSTDEDGGAISLRTSQFTTTYHPDPTWNQPL